MPPPQETTPGEVRKLVLVQVGLTALFLVVIFVLLDGLDADRPAIWLMILPLLVLALGVFLAERSWLRVAPLTANAPDPESAGLAAFVSHTLRKFVLCEGALLICVILAFVSDRAGWLVVIAGIPGLAVLAFEAWPSARNLSLTAAMLDAQGAESRLLETFETA